MVIAVFVPDDPKVVAVRIQPAAPTGKIEKQLIAGRHCRRIGLSC
jgi:hypothetical protein